MLFSQQRTTVRSSAVQHCQDATRYCTQSWYRTPNPSTLQIGVASTVAFMPDGQEGTGDTEGSDAGLAEQLGADGLLAVGQDAGDDRVGFGAGQRGVGFSQLDG